MTFWRSWPGALVVVAALAVLSVLGVVGRQIYGVTHPPRQPEMSLNLGAELARVETVQFRSTDGVALRGWLLRGEPGKPAVLLAHDLGESKNALINLAIALNKAGLTVLAFDFRGHGGSGGSGSTLGVDEARDVLGAADFLADLPDGEVDARGIGAFGAGMGAHAVALAAADRPILRVLVLDGLWPDARWMLVGRTFRDWPWAQRNLGAIPALVFPLVVGTSVDSRRAADVLPAVARRDLLLVAPAGDARLDDAMKAMYATLPERKDAERNLVTLPGTRASGLTGAELARYHGQVVGFFLSRLAGS